MAEHKHNPECPACWVPSATKDDCRLSYFIGLVHVVKHGLETAKSKMCPGCLGKLAEVERQAGVA